MQNELGPKGSKVTSKFIKNDPKLPPTEPSWPKLYKVGSRLALCWPKGGRRGPKMASRWRKLAPESLQDGPIWRQYARRSPSWCQDGLMCAQVGPKMSEVKPKTDQSRPNMLPSELLLATIWPQDCMKDGKAKTQKKQRKTNDLLGLQCPS